MIHVHCLPCSIGRDVFICVKVLSEVLLKDQVDVIPDILKLEAEVIPILQEVSAWQFVCTSLWNGTRLCVYSMYEGLTVLSYSSEYVCVDDANIRKSTRRLIGSS